MQPLTTTETDSVVESLYVILAEVEDNPDISQGAVDNLHESLMILGVIDEKIQTNE